MVSKFGDLLEHRQGTGSMSMVGKYYLMGGGVKPGVRLVLPGGDIGGPAIWSVFIDDINRSFL